MSLRDFVFQTLCVDTGWERKRWMVWAVKKKKTEREGGREYKKDGKASRGSHRKAERKTD